MRIDTGGMTAMCVLQQTGLPQAVFAPSDRQLVVKMNYLLTR